MQSTVLTTRKLYTYGVIRTPRTEYYFTLIPENDRPVENTAMLDLTGPLHLTYNRDGRALRTEEKEMRFTLEFSDYVHLLDFTKSKHFDHDKMLNMVKTSLDHDGYLYLQNDEEIVVLLDPKCILKSVMCENA